MLKYKCLYYVKTGNISMKVGAKVPIFYIKLVVIANGFKLRGKIEEYCFKNNDLTYGGNDCII